MESLITPAVSSVAGPLLLGILQQANMGPRFSLRTLFILVTLAAIICYWIARPSIGAARFVDSAKNLDFTTANDFMDDNSYLFAGWSDRNFAIRANASMMPWRLSQVLYGERNAEVVIEYLDVADRLQKSIVVRVTATPFGLKARPMR
jgi:hypothetical protein